MEDKELRRQKRKKYLKYFIIFVIFQVIVVTVAALTVLKFKNPKFRVRSASFDTTFELGTQASPSFNLAMDTRFGIKNTNFGPFKYQDTTVDFYYRNTKVGEAFLPRKTASLMSTKKVNVLVTLSSGNLTSMSELATDISSGVIPLTSQSRMRGKVTIMFLMKKKRTGTMDCSMEVALLTKQLQNLRCK